MKIKDKVKGKEYEVYNFAYNEIEDYVSVIYIKEDGELHWIKEDNKDFSKRYEIE